MSLPPLISAEVAEKGLPSAFTDGCVTVDVHHCEGAKFHSPHPLLVRQIQVTNGHTAWLCSTCADNFTMLRWILANYGGQVPWPLRREFGNDIRRLAMIGQP